MNTPEPWLRGPLPGVHPLLAPLLFSFQQAREDLHFWVGKLTDVQVWERPSGLPSVGFQLRHIGGSIDRLLTYAQGGQLTETQLDVLRREMEPGDSAAQLLSALDRQLDAAEAAVRLIDPGRLTEERAVGRKLLRTTLGGLLTHIAEHTQRHVGQAITTAKILLA